MNARIIVFGLLALSLAAEAQAQTRTSTGVEFESERLNDELGDWETGARPGDTLDSPFDGPGAPRSGAAPGGAPRTDTPPGAPRSTSAPVQGFGAPVQGFAPPPPADAKIDAELLATGEEQRATGRIFLIVGVASAVLGTGLGVGGIARASNNPSSTGGAEALMVLSGLAIGAAGGAGIIAGSVLMHRGGKKMDRARGVKLMHLGPAFFGPDAAPGLAVGLSY